jgi:arginase
MKARMVTLINAPSILGLRPIGVELLPDALHRAGLEVRLGIQQSETVLPPPYNPRRDGQSKMLNLRAIAGYSVALADAVQQALQAGRFPLVLGGDCSIVLGPMLALKRTGRFGLFFLDGHADFYQPEASPTGEAADMDLALVSGRGPEIVTDIESQKPLVRDKDIVLFGQRDRRQTMAEGSQQVTDTDIRVFELDSIRRRGVRQSCTRALAQLLRQPVEGFWVHMDADVIDDQEMPAVDYRLPGGLALEELHTVLDLLLASHKAVGLDLTIYNPALDPRGTMAAELTNLLAASLKGR